MTPAKHSLLRLATRKPGWECGAGRVEGRGGDGVK